MILAIKRTSRSRNYRIPPEGLFWYRKLLRNPYTITLRRMHTRARCRCVASALGARMSLATFFFKNQIIETKYRKRTTIYKYKTEKCDIVRA